MLNLIRKFTAYNHHATKINYQNGSIHIFSASDKPIYVKLYELTPTECELLLQNNLQILFCSENIVQLCFHFIDKNGQVIHKSLYKSGEILHFTSPENTSHISMFLRVSKGSATVSKIVVGKEQELQSVTDDKSIFSADFDYSHVVKLPIESVFIVETVFCDIETRDAVLDRYFSFLMAQAKLFSALRNSSVFWVVHISHDKQRYIQSLNSIIAENALQYNIFVNVYEHPAQGYFNKKDKHIDRLMKPNVTYPSLRDRLFDQAVYLIQGKYDASTTRRYIRGVLDDDDFLNPAVFSCIERYCKGIENYYQSEEYILFNRKIRVAYFEQNGCVTVDKVLFRRSVSGCRFSVGLNKFSVHPFGISESVTASDDSEQLRLDISEVDGVSYSFTYNRHVGNLSNHQKNHHYVNLIASESFMSHNDFVLSFLRSSS